MALTARLRSFNCILSVGRGVAKTVFNHLFDRYSLCTYYVPGIMSDPRDIQRARPTPSPRRASFLVRKLQTCERSIKEEYLLGWW